LRFRKIEAVGTPGTEVYKHRELKFSISGQRRVRGEWGKMHKEEEEHNLCSSTQVTEVINLVETRMRLRDTLGFS
jgi:hypothetical protein